MGRTIPDSNATTFGNEFSNNLISNFIDINNFNQGTSLRTELEILKSSVLMPVFEFVKNEKVKKGQSVNNFLFTSWVDSLDLNYKVHQ